MNRRVFSRSWAHKQVWAGAFGAALLAAGCEGPEGLAGVDGKDGTDGVNGTNGTNGKDGVVGRDGTDGVNGTNGTNGVNGTDGTDGVDGVNGSNGTNGTSGTDGLNGSNDPRMTAVRVPASLAGHDRFYGVTYHDSGSFYAVGQVQLADDSDPTNDDDYAFLIAKFRPNGSLDESFGTGGFVTHNLAVGGDALEQARGVVLQSDDKVVVAGYLEHDPTAAMAIDRTDTDIAVIRLNTDGTLDTTFGDVGDNGVQILDLSTASRITTNATTGAMSYNNADSIWSIALASNDKLVLHGVQRTELMAGVTRREDTDWVLVRLNSDGTLDNTFAGDGTVTLDIEDPMDVTRSNASARTANVLGDDSIVAAGYTTTAFLTGTTTTTQQPVIYKVDANGNFDATFAVDDPLDQADPNDLPGVWHGYASVPTLRAEAYSAAPQGTSFVTIGYGPTPGSGTGTDWISLRFTGDGHFDTSYGDNGRAYIDVAGFGDNGRFVMVLPDDRVLGVGVGRASAAEADAMVAILTKDGQPDTSFAPSGVKLYDIGFNADHFWSAALSPSGKLVAIVGIAGTETSGILNDDGALLLLQVN